MGSATKGHGTAAPAPLPKSPAPVTGQLPHKRTHNHAHPRTHAHMHAHTRYTPSNSVVDRDPAVFQRSNWLAAEGHVMRAGRAERQ